MASSRDRGLTLVELLVSIAAGLIVITAAVAAGNALLQSLYGQTKKSAVETQLAIAHVIMERGLYNAGASWSEGMYALHVRNNVSGTALSDGTTVTTLGTANTTGIIVGTDVIEVAYADTGQRAVGTVTSVSPPSTITTSGDPFLLTANGSVTLDSANPSGMVGEVMLFSNSGQTGITNPTFCMAKISAVTTLPTVSISYLNDDFTTSGTQTLMTAAQASNGPLTCPLAGMRASLLNTRTRFAICQVYTPGAPLTSGLCTQTNGGNGMVTLGSLQLVAPGIEDMQITERVLASVAGPCTNPIAGDPYCWCNNSSGACPSNGGPVVEGNAALEEAVRGFDITLSGTGVSQVPLTGGFRPAIYDHAAGAVDNLYHAVQEQSMFAINVALGNM